MLSESVFGIFGMWVKIYQIHQRLNTAILEPPKEIFEVGGGRVAKMVPSKALGTG